MTLKIVHKNDTPVDDGPEWRTEIVPSAELLHRLKELNQKGWVIHTVQREYSQTNGPAFWVLAVK